MKKVNKRTRWIIFIAFLTIGFFICSVLGMNKYSAIEYKIKFLETKVIGYQIIVALEKYHSNYSKYPSSLESLVPDYSYGFMAPRTGSKEWTYFDRSDGQEFHLHVDSIRSEGALDYDSVIGSWYYGTHISEP